jgi:hypothetical protein
MSVDSEAHSALDASEGLCYRHTRAAQRVRGPGAEYIAAHARLRVEALLKDLDEVIRKEDYRFRDEPRTEAERAAPARAIAWTAGVEGLT